MTKIESLLYQIVTLFSLLLIFITYLFSPFSYSPLLAVKFVSIKHARLPTVSEIRSSVSLNFGRCLC